jgi:hypothetical protein
VLHDDDLNQDDELIVIDDINMYEHEINVPNPDLGKFEYHENIDEDYFHMKRFFRYICLIRLIHSK